MKLRVAVKLGGQAETAAALTGVKAGVQNRVLKAACGKQARKGVKVAKGALHGKRTGQLAKSLGTVYRKYKRGDVWVFIDGPRKGFKIQVGMPGAGAQKRFVKKYVKRLGRPLTDAEREKLMGRYVDPVKYGHLVEGGRKPVRPSAGKKVLSDGITVFGRSSFGVQPKPFMAPAASAVAGSKGEMVADIRAGIDREAAKYAAKGKSIRG